MSYHLGPQLPGHLARLTTSLEQGGHPTVQQDAMNRKFGTFSHLAPRITAWLQVIILLFWSGWASLLPLHSPAVLGVFARIINSAPSVTRCKTVGTWQSGIVCASCPVLYPAPPQKPEEPPDQGLGDSNPCQGTICLWKRHRTHRTAQRPPK